MKKILQWLTALWQQLFKDYQWLRPRAEAAVIVANIIKDNRDKGAAAIRGILKRHWNHITIINNNIWH